MNARRLPLPVSRAHSPRLELLLAAVAVFAAGLALGAVGHALATPPVVYLARP